LRKKKGVAEGTLNEKVKREEDEGMQNKHHLYASTGGANCPRKKFTRGTTTRRGGGKVRGKPL